MDFPISCFDIIIECPFNVTTRGEQGIESICILSLKYRQVGRRRKKKNNRTELESRSERNLLLLIISNLAHNALATLVQLEDLD